ncbi:MAG: DUF695 domain-containing protein [Bacteroidales bacterium]
MSISNKNELTSAYKDFWAWFETNESTFHKAVKENDNVVENFFDYLATELDKITEGIFYLSGMYDENTSELILTADGNLENIVLIEELINVAPSLKNWKFTALKPEHDIENMSIKMGDYTFNKDNISFYATEHEYYPDLVDIVLVHDDYTEQNKDNIANGVLIYLDNYLGELRFAVDIDEFSFASKTEAKSELIPLSKLKDYIIWREKEFLEKYNKVDTCELEDKYSQLSADLSNGKPLLAIINTNLLNWEHKASHPWVLSIEISYTGAENGMPTDTELSEIYEFEDMLEKNLEVDGVLYIGRQTADGSREIYYVSDDFRAMSKIMFFLKNTPSIQLDFDYEIYKDKYWQSFERFNVN